MNETRVCKIRKFYIRKVKSFCTYLCIFFYRILETSKSVVCQNLMEHVKREDGNTFWLQNPEWLPVGSIQFLSLPPQPMTSDLKLWIHFSKDSNKFLMKKKIWKSFIILLSSSRFQINSVVSFRQSNTIIWTLMSLCTGKVLSLLEACFDLISSPSPSMKIQIMGGKITENLGFKVTRSNLGKEVSWLYYE